MKILMVSMPSLHFYRWVEQLKDSGHEIYWFDVVDGGEEVLRIDWVHQIVGWKRKYNFPGRYFIKEKFPKLYRIIKKFNEYDTGVIFEQQLKKIKPDVVHSFALYVSCTPIINVMNKYPSIKWIYSSWGSDLFYFQNKLSYLVEIKRVLLKINYLFTDCHRDFEIAKRHGFKGVFLGVFPGGGGYDMAKMDSFISPLEMRQTIAIKGFQGRSGRAISVLKALQKLKLELSKFRIIIFGADQDVFEFMKSAKELQKIPNLNILGQLSHEDVLKLMGESFMYIGNSNSDGMPNTLLESIIMGAYPIQSNPGGATEEIIINGKNGLLIENPENVGEIRDLIQKAISDKESLKSGIEYNFENIKPKLEKEAVKKQILEKYCYISNNLKINTD